MADPIEMQNQLVERRKPQRDWVGHSIQLIAILSVIGVPMLIWGTGVNSTLAILAERSHNQETTITAFQNYELQVQNQFLEANKQLAIISAQIGALREEPRLRR